MKFKSVLSACILSIALILSPGCTTTPTGQTIPDPEVLQVTAQEAAAIGTQLWLGTHPNDRAQFELARTSLSALIATGKGSAADLQAALSNLPIKQLSGTNGSVIVTTAAILISKGGQQLAKLDTAGVWNNYVEPVAQGLLDGLNQALGTPQSSIVAPCRCVASLGNSGFYSGDGMVLLPLGKSLSDDVVWYKESPSIYITNGTISLPHGVELTDER